MKKIFLGILITGITFLTSAFTNVELTVRYTYVFISTISPQYKKFKNFSNPSLFINSEIGWYSYTITSAGASTVVANSYTIAQMEAFANENPAKVIRSKEKGIFLGD